jgi:Tn3 transposase DDE domain
MGEIVARLRAAGEAVSDEDLARISPLAYAHVIPTVPMCLITIDEATLRPLRRHRLSQIWGRYPHLD